MGGAVAGEDYPPGTGVAAAGANYPPGTVAAAAAPADGKGRGQTGAPETAEGACSLAGGVPQSRGGGGAAALDLGHHNWEGGFPSARVEVAAVA